MSSVFNFGDSIWFCCAGVTFAVTKSCVEEMNPKKEEPTEGFTLSRDEPSEPETEALETTQEEVKEDAADLEEQISNAVREALDGQVLNASDMLKLERLRSEVYRRISGAFVEFSYPRTGA